MILQIPMVDGSIKIVSNTNEIIKRLIARRYESEDPEEIEYINEMLTTLYNEKYKDIESR